MIYKFTEVLNDLVNYFILGDILLLESWKRANNLSDDLATEFTTNESGDRAFSEGIVIPMSGIENYPYTVLFNLSGDKPELCKGESRLQFRRSGYSLKVDNNMLMLFTWHILKQFTPEKVKTLISYYRQNKKPIVELANGWYHIEILGGETLQDGDYEPTLSDERIEKAITQNEARLIILDPIQAYMGEKTDMNRANEVRPMFRRLADVAERTGCAVILIGHLNKAAGGQSAYRGLGSIDFRAAARSVLLIGRVKREPNVRVIVHDKSSLAPEGKPVAFCLDPETGFSWIGEYDITADELLSGAGGNTTTKTEQAEKLILDLLADGKELASEDIVKAAAEAGISERTVKNARRNLDTRIEVIRRGNQWYYRRNEAKSAK